MRFEQGFLLGCLLLLLAVPAFAVVSAAGAVDLVETENHFLKQNEAVETPTVLIKHDNKKYWLVPLLSGEDVATFFPISFSDKTIAKNKAIDSQLFSTAKFLRDYLAYRNKVVQQGSPWFIGRDNQLIIGSLADELEAEAFELNIIRADLSVSDAVSGIPAMQQSLDSMARLSTGLSQKIGVAVDAESRFVTEPTSQDLESIRNSFVEAFDGLSALEQEARLYKDAVQNLKQVIASDNVLSSDQKSRFVALADAPRALFTIGSMQIGNWVIATQENQQQIEQLLNESKSKLFLDAAQAELEKRIKMNEAYTAIYGVDESFSKETGYASLQLAMTELQAPDKKNFWKNQAQLGIAIEQFDKAVQFLEAESFDLSLIAAHKAKRAVKIVKKDGFIALQTHEWNATQVINIIIILVLILIALYFLKNRRQILGAVMSESAPTEVDVYEWKKK